MERGEEERERGGMVSGDDEVIGDEGHTDCRIVPSPGTNISLTPLQTTTRNSLVYEL